MNNYLSLKLLGAIKNRHCIREYTSEEIPKRTINLIMEACRWAPSAHNAQPWRFIVITDHSKKCKLAENMAKCWGADLTVDGISIIERKNLTEASIKQFSNAPVLIVACLTMEDMDQYPDEHRKKIEYIMAVQSVSVAIENLLLAANGIGLGACWYCAPLFCPEIVKKTLNIPEQFEPQALITLGYPLKKSEPTPRRPLKEIIIED